MVSVTDLDEYHSTWDSLASKGAKVVHPAHGKSFEAAKLRKFLGAHRRTFPWGKADSR